MSLESLQEEGIISTPKEEWKEEFDAEIAPLLEQEYSESRSQVESFIRKTLATERARIAGQVKEMRVRKFSDDKTIQADYFVGYTECKQKILSLLQTP